MIQVKLNLELVESLIEGGSEYVGTVLILELKELMETSICVGLLNGLQVTLRGAFEEAWFELVVEDDPVDMEMI